MPMANVINLRVVRKQKARAEKEQRAVQNRALHGRTREERELENARSARLRNDLDAHRREGPTSRQGDE